MSDSEDNAGVVQTSMVAPVAMFVYDRLAHTEMTVSALRNNALATKTDVVIFSDGPKNHVDEGNVASVRRYIGKVEGFKSVRVIKSDRNLGLAKSIITGVTRICQDYGRVIVVEDDLVTSPSFLTFLNSALELYENDESVGSIHGYWYPIDSQLPRTFFLRGASCWGWATWSRAWQQFEPDGRTLLAKLKERGLLQKFDLDGAMAYTRMLQDQIDGKTESWAIRWHATMFLAGKLQLIPSASLVRNIGFDGTGAHKVRSHIYDVAPSTFVGDLNRIAIEESEVARGALINYYRSYKKNLAARIIGRLRRLLES